MVVIVYYSSITGGHVALSLTGLQTEQNIYISLYTPNKSVPNVRLHSVEFDGPEQVSEIVVLPSEESCGYGLSEKEIYHWWKHDFNPTINSYRFFGRNCATAVYEALRVGQEKSETLGKKALPYDTYTISWPINTITYAKKISEHLLKNHSVFSELYLKYAELKEYCRTDRPYIPYDQAVAFYSRLKQFNHFSEYCLIINKPFCDGIKKTLLQFKSSLEKIEDEDVNLTLGIIDFSAKPDEPSITTFAKINAMLSIDNISEGDIDAHFDKLRTLANYFCTLTTHERETLLDMLNQAIKKELLPPLSQHISQADLISIKEKERIREVFNVMKEKIDDENNPHKTYISKVNDVVTALFGFT